MGNKTSENVNIGDWYSMCCILDLYQIQDEEHLEWVKDLLNDGEDDWGMNTWKTLKEAMDEIVNIWGDDINERPDLMLLLENENKENN